MIGKNSHIIQQQYLDVDFGSIENGLGMQNRIAEVFYDRLQPAMEALFDEMCDASNYMSIERLEIDCGIVSQKNWEEEWVTMSIRKLKEELLQVNKSRQTKDHAAEHFFFFIEYGYFSWNARISSPGQLEQFITIDHAFLGKLNVCLRGGRSVIERLISQFSLPFLEKLKKEILAEYKSSLQIFDAEADETVSRFNRNDYANFLRLFGQQMIEKDFQSEDKMSLNKTGVEIKASRTQPELDTEKESSESKEAIYINNAGLILLHPFLPQLFEQLGLTKQGAWISPDANRAAVYISEFLVTGIPNEIPESDLPLNKILCGMTPEDPLLALTIINDEAIAACNELLSEVIRHWSVLKNTGIDALQETFLQRKGKLTRVDKGWFLKVEQRGLDVLLGSLPWGIGISRLPWMNELLYTEW